MAGALLLCVAGLLPWREALAAAARGNDVYLFLAGMMLISELARKTGLFDHVAALAVRGRRGSARRLFVLVYGFVRGHGVHVERRHRRGADACGAGRHARRAGQASAALFYACAFIANAASFVLPISNPANLVLFGERMPPLAAGWRASPLPSVVAIVIDLRRPVLDAAPRAGRTHRHGRAGAAADAAGVKLTTLGIVGTGVALLVASLRGQDLRLAELHRRPGHAGRRLRHAALRLLAPALKEVSWGVLPLVAGLFVLVAGLERTGLVDTLAQWVRDLSAMSVQGGARPACSAPAWPAWWWVWSAIS